MKRYRLISTLGAALLCLSVFAGPSPQVGDFRHAQSLYQKGMYAEAKALFDKMDKSAQSEGYSLLCEERLSSGGYESRMADYLYRYPYSGLSSEIRYRHALNLFDGGNYREAQTEFGKISSENISKGDQAEYLFKKAYCDFDQRNYDSALEGLGKVIDMPQSDFTAPAQYTTGYILYEREQFSQAIPWFEKSVRDPRFESISKYYIMECHFMDKDYSYVTQHGPEIYEDVPEERKPHLARIISESYLVLGDASSARQYYDVVKQAPQKSRGDYFYAGSLLYTTGDYAGAIENFSKMTDRSDSTGQAANYLLASSYIKTRDKVSAMEAFKDAASVSYNPQIQEDSYFNWAKLAFDLNNDPTVFEGYLKKYSNKTRGDQIYSYMALASLLNHDYEAAVQAYDKIDDLDADMRQNYMKANYLRANQLINSESYRDAIPHLKAVTYYTDKRSDLSQLSRYWLAESYYRDDKYSQAQTLFTELYNQSALEGRSEGKLLPYNIGYSYFKDGKYDQAVKWFDKYLASSDKTNRRDAMLRKADAAFIGKDYKGAAAAYENVIKAYPSLDDLYPYYQGGLSYGLAKNNAKKTELLSTAVKASPKSAFYNESLYELARSYMASGKDSKAAECYNTIIRGASDKGYVARSLIGMGMISRNASKYDEALGYYKKVVSENPGTEYAEDALLAIESIYQSKKEPEKYVDYVESLGSASGKSASDKEKILFAAAEQNYLSGNYSKALVSLESYMDKYPKGADTDKALFYTADCYKNLGKKEKACDYYAKVMKKNGSYAELSALNYASLSYSMEKYKDAFQGYSTLAKVARIDANKHTSVVGMMESAYRARDSKSAITYADKVLSDKASTADEKTEAKYVKAKSLMSSSDRTGALKIMEELSRSPKTAQGAEAAYTLIQDAYDRGDFASVKKKVFALSDSGTGQTYWLAKSFILLGDAYAEQGEYAQAKATFESIRDGYKSGGTSDDVLDNVNMRLKKLSQMGK